jgi:type I restriction enzyme M protein
MKAEQGPITEVGQWLRVFNSYELARHDPAQVFDNYLEIALCALAAGRLEDRYLRVAKRYTRSELDLIVQLFAYHIRIHEHQVRERGWYDMLGDVYMEIAGRSRASRMGQFFTPPEICTFNAAMMVPEDALVTDRTTFYDPAVGSGRTLLAAHALRRGKGVWYGADLDPTCFKMCALNFWLHGVRGEVAWMDSLSCQWYAAYHAHPRNIWPFVTLLDDERKTESHLFMHHVSRAESAPAEASTTSQLYLFDADGA